MVPGSILKRRVNPPSILFLTVWDAEMIAELKQPTRVISPGSYMLRMEVNQEENIKRDKEFQSLCSVTLEIFLLNLFHMRKK